MRVARAARQAGHGAGPMALPVWRADAGDAYVCVDDGRVTGYCYGGERYAAFGALPPLRRAAEPVDRLREAALHELAAWAARSGVVL